MKIRLTIETLSSEPVVNSFFTLRLPIAAETEERKTYEQRGFMPRQPGIVSRTRTCEENQSLLDTLGEIVQELILLHEQQFLAIAAGDSECNRFDILIHMTNERKQKAKYAYLHHIETHGCATARDC